MSARYAQYTAWIQLAVIILSQHSSVFGFCPQPRRAAPIPSSRAATVEESDSPSTTDVPVVPITLLSGFLGTGKTTALKHLLQNTENVKIGVIVNDVAEVNIDAKLVNSEKNLDGVIELENGCACCSLADELVFSVDDLMKDRNLDAIVVELSGVADPFAIKNNWLMAPPSVKEKADIARVVTVIDAASFGTDYMSWDEARERKGWLPPDEAMSGMGGRKVSELLAEQVESADLILVNKVDLADGEEQVAVAEKVATALNNKAKMRRVEFGVVSPSMILGDGSNQKFLSKEEIAESKSKCKSTTCNDPDCSDASHGHSHSHSHAEEKESTSSCCSDPDCTNAKEMEPESSSSSCSDPSCSDASHSHSHSHSHGNDEYESVACDDPDCTDPTHDHEHSHNHFDELGITNFVFRATRPFDPVRLISVLDRWPVPIKDTLDLEALGDREDVETGDMIDSPFLGVLRSKGFCWFSPSEWTGPMEDGWRHDTAMYWSHAGKSFTLSAAGKWWGVLDKETMKKYFVTNMKEFERILKEDFQTEEFADRRQELVFIGVNMDVDRINKTLEDCLVAEKDMDKYRTNLRKYETTKMS